MNKPRFIPLQFWDKLFVIIGALFVLLPVSPLNMQHTYRDSGVFLYIGWRILNGELPYRDVWDHKPPIIFYINALGLAFSGGSRWGVWLIELICLMLASFIGYKIMRKALGTFPAVCSTLLWLLTLFFVIDGGNLTTEYTLPLQFAAWLLSMSIFEKPYCCHWQWMLLGFLGAIAFYTKQTAIGIWISIILYLILYRVRSNQLKKLLFEVLNFCFGFIAVSISWIIFFYLMGGLFHFWSAAFDFNFVYSMPMISFLDRLRPFIVGIMPLAQVGLLQFGGIGYLLGLVLVIFRKDILHHWSPSLIIGLLDLPIEFVLISFSGRSYSHYYMTLLPAFAFFTGITFWILFSSRYLDEVPQSIKNVLVLGIIGVFLFASLNQYRTKVISFRSGQHPAVEYIITETNPKDTVLLWGAEASINFFSHRKSPTRFVYQYPLYTQGYVNEAMVIEFLDDVIQHRPRLIIDTHNAMTPIFQFPIYTYDVEQRIAYLQCYYRVVEGTVIYEWTVYEYQANDCPP